MGETIMYSADIKCPMQNWNTGALRKTKQEAIDDMNLIIAVASRLGLKTSSAAEWATVHHPDDFQVTHIAITHHVIG